MVEISYIIISVILVVVAVILIFYLIARSKGKIEIQLSNYSFSPGDTIEGKIILRLKKPVESNSLNVGLVGMQKTVSPKFSGRSAGSETHYQEVFNFKQPLEGKKGYPIGEKEYSFKIKVPLNIMSKAGNNPLADTVVRSMQILSGNMSAIQWYVKANLEVPGFDLSKKVQINMS